MAIFKAKVDSEYVQIPNETLQDKEITFEARGLLAMLLSMPPDWEVHKSWVISQSPAGRDKITAIFKELENAGYIRKEEGQRKYGKFSSDDYFVFPNKSTVTDLPHRSNRIGQTVNGEPASIKETVKQNKHKENKQSNVPKKAQRRVKPESWKRFYSEYPEFRRGASDSTPWNKAKSLGLSDADFDLMLADVVERKSKHSEWVGGYVQGITKYISERVWLTPIASKPSVSNYITAQDDTSWGQSMAQPYIPNQQKVLGHE